jgi:predicted nucleic acid-binding protein
VRPLRLYLDTSVYGGCFDAEFADESTRMFDLLRAGHVFALVTDVIVRELNDAPSVVRELFRSLPPDMIEVIDLTPAVLELRDKHLAAGIVAPRSANDATHVAAATVARADAIVSWNFRDIVRLDKVRAFNQVNLLNGYGLLSIVSPREVQIDDDEQATEGL